MPWGGWRKPSPSTAPCLEIRARVLGAEHPDTLASRDNLALVLGDLGRLKEAEAEHRTVLEIRTRVLGAEHPHTLASRGNLALVLSDLGRLEEAESEHRAELEICARVLGAEHPHTLASRGNLAAVLSDLGRLDEAEAEHRAVAGDPSTRPGRRAPRHPDQPQQPRPRPVAPGAAGRKPSPSTALTKLVLRPDDDQPATRAAAAATTANTAAKPLDNHLSQADSCGMSAQRTDRNGRSWTTCPLLRIRSSADQGA